MTSSSIALRVSRIAAVVLALTVLSYLAVQAQRGANPPAHAGARPQAGVVESTPQHGPTRSESSLTNRAGDSAQVIELEDGFGNSADSLPLNLLSEEPQSGHFLFSSKSGVVQLPVPVAGELPPSQAANDVGLEDPYLPSSKVLRVDLRPVPQPLPVLESDDPQSDAEQVP